MKKRIFLLSVLFFIVGMVGFNTKTEASINGIYYRSHLRDLGWEKNYSYSGQTSGTVGRNIPMEGFELNYEAYKPNPDSQILMRSHVQDLGWLPWTANNFTGTMGKAKNMEAIQITLAGEFAQLYDIEYRTHVTNKGWLPWVKNGVTSGTVGKNYAMQAIEVRLVPKR